MQWEEGSSKPKWEDPAKVEKVGHYYNCSAQEHRPAASPDSLQCVLALNNWVSRSEPTWSYNWADFSIYTMSYMYVYASFDHVSGYCNVSTCLFFIVTFHETQYNVMMVKREARLRRMIKRASCF